MPGDRDWFPGAIGGGHKELVFGKLFLKARNHPSHQRTTLMGLFSKDIQTMDDLLLHGRTDIYYAENQIGEIPRPGTHPQGDQPRTLEGLRGRSRRDQELEIARLDQVFQKLGE